MYTFINPAFLSQNDAVAPQIYIVVTSVVYGIAEYTLELQFETQSDGLVVVALNYSNHLLSNFTTTNSSIKLQNLIYNGEYLLYATASNCCNEKNTTTLEINEGKRFIVRKIVFLKTLKQLVAELHHLQSMVVLRSTAVQRREQRSSSTVMMDTLLMRRCHHNVSTHHGPLTQWNFIVAPLVSLSILTL